MTIKNNSNSDSNICFFNSNQAWGGGEKWHYNAAIALLAKNCQVTVATHGTSELKQKINDLNSNIQLDCFNIGKMSFLNPFMVFKLYRFFKKNNFDCVILNLPSDAKTVGFAAKLAKVPKVIYRRGMPHPIRASLINNITYKNFITHIIANSQIVKESIFYNIKSLEDKIQIIYNGVESPNGKVPNTYSSPTSSFPTILGNVGRLVKQKGQQYLIDLAIELKKENFPFKIYIAGKGPLEEELKRKIKQFRLTETVILEGHVKSEELFNKIDIFVFTSEFEGLSNALIESLSYQKPVICFDTSSNAEIVEDGQSGNIIPAYDIIKMKEAIIALANDPEKYQRYQKNGLKAVQTKFNHQEKMNELYQLVKS